MGLIKGSHSYFANGPFLEENLTNVIMGKYCSIAKDVIWDCGFNHSTKYISTFPFNKIFPECAHINKHPISYGNIICENSVWVGTKCIIRSGVTLSNGCIVGANSVVTHDVKPYEIVAGSPAKHIRFIFTKDKIDILQRIKWWDWPEYYVKKYANVLMSEDVYELENIYNNIIKGL